MKLLYFAGLAIIILGFVPAYAETLQLATEKGTLEVRLSYDEITPGELTTLHTDFINPQTQAIQEHIDWRFSVSQGGEIIWGPTQLSHTSDGSLKNLKYEFPGNGIYTIEFGVEGILFQPIPPESVSFDVTVGDVVAESAIPGWIKNNAGWWADGTITDSDFITGIQYLIQQEILVVSESEVSAQNDEGIPEWIKNNAGWWAQGLISDDDFLNGIQYLIGIGLISVEVEAEVEAEAEVQMQTYAGEFQDADFIHRTSGTATVTISGDSKTLEFTNFDVTNGPDLYVYLSADKSDRDFVDLGLISSFRGDQSYTIPATVDISKYDHVLIWCKAFGVLFGSAQLSEGN